MVFYLKYRPQRLDDLDLPEIKQALKKLFAKKSKPPALLFTGPRGSGKTSAARIVAKALNCLKNKSLGNPCGKCETCQAIANGRFLDLLEIDGASNRGIDDVRSLRENIKLSATSGRFKVYIIDEVHMLTKEAFNALLKTLEEPPGHVLFVLCTTEPEKIPETIISRCLKFNFRKATPKEVATSLEKVVKGEKIKVEKGVLELIAKRVDGSFRDSQKILDQLWEKGKTISLLDAQKLLGQTEAHSPQKLLVTLAARDAKAGLLEIGRLVASGVNLKSYLLSFLETVRGIIMTRVGLEGQEENQVLDQLDLSTIKDLLVSFSQVSRQLKEAIIPQLPLEIAVIEWGEEEIKNSNLKSQKVSLVGTNQEKESGPKRAPVSEVVAKSQGKEASAKVEIGVRQTASKKEESGNGKTLAQVVAAEPEHSDNGNGNGNGNGHGNLSLETIMASWSEVLSGVKPVNHSIGALLKTCKPCLVEGEFLTLEVYYPFHKERLETAKCREVVEQVAGDIFQSPVKIKCVLGERETVRVKSSAPTASGGVPANGTLTEAEKIFKGKLV
ncbi:DNA polymerase III subunit gamma/tau [Patescibacteria group bacterium]